MVKINISDQTFTELSKVVQKMNLLEEIDISQNSIRPKIFLDMLKAIVKNKKINYINLSWNILAQDSDDMTKAVENSHDR